MKSPPWLIVVALVLISLSPAGAGDVIDANGNAVVGIVKSHKTGASARVSPQYAAKFQAYIDDLESHGASIRFMGGTRRGKCWSGGMHPCGKALDVCQTGRGRVDTRCHLPSRHELVRIAAAHGLTEGGIWCHSDMGHVQVGESAPACSSRSTTIASARSYRMHRAHAEPAQWVATFDPLTAQ